MCSVETTWFAHTCITPDAGACLQAPVPYDSAYVQFFCGPL